MTTTNDTTPVDIADTIAECVEYIRLNSHVTFVELERILKRRGVQSQGSLTWEMSGCPNMALWVGMSAEFCDVADAVLRTEHIELRSTVLLTYLIDGGLPQLPIAKRPPRNGYKELHWAPVVFCWTGPRVSRSEVLKHLEAAP